MELNDCIKELKEDQLTIEKLAAKYNTLLRDHMKLKKQDRKEHHDLIRTILFHVSGNLAMARSAFATYITRYNNGF